MQTEKHQTVRECLVCGKTLKGRTDKKFCDDSCRNLYNNRAKGKTNGYMRRINEILRKNRKLLEEILPPDRQAVRTSREKLVRLGFNFNHVTHFYPQDQDRILYFCYEYGFILAGRERVIVFREEWNHSA